MPYVISVLAAAAASVALLVLLVRLNTTVRRLTGTARLCRAYLAERVNLLRARIAGLKAELNRRRQTHARSSGDPTAG